MLKCSQEHCELEVFENSNKCILHCEKSKIFDNERVISEFEKQFQFLIKKENEKNIFYEEATRSHCMIQKEVKKIFNPKSKYIVESIDDLPYFIRNIVFPSFSENIFIDLEYRNINFTNCKFFGKNNLNLITKERDINFINCEFFNKILLII